MKIDLQNRSPKVEKLPDDRLRVTRLYDVINFVPKTPASLIADVWLDWGTQDAEFTNCRLIKQSVSGQEGDSKNPVGEPPKLIRVYEEIPATAEVRVGEPSVTINQYGYAEVTIFSIQFSAGTATYSDPGTTTAPAPWTNCVLRDQEDTDDGTLRTIKRTYVEGGQLAQYDELKFGGHLLLRTLKYLNQVPPTPSGFTLVTQSIEYVNGLPVYAYGYASGSVAAGNGGVIGQDVQYNLSPDQGATGVTVTTITYLSALSVISNPITGPVGAQLIKVTYDDAEGYRRWVGVYASGTGMVRQDKDIREGGKLIVYSRTGINAVPTTPSATIGGTVTLIKDDQRNGTDAAAGVIVYERVWAEGFGEVSRDLDYGQSVDEGTTGTTVVTITHLTALGASDPTTPPAGTVKISSSPNVQDGYIRWVVKYAKGAGTVAQIDDTKYNGALLLRKIIALGAAPATPSGYTLVTTNVRNADGYVIYDYDFAKGVGEISRDIQYGQSSDEGTTGTTVTSIRYIVAPAGTIQPTSLAGSVLIKKEYTEQDGYRIWSTVWAKGTGLVLDESNIQVKDALVVYHRTALGSAPSAPLPTIGGTVTLFEESVRNADGYTIYDRRWAEGDGQSNISTTGQEDGALVYTVTTLNLAAATPAYPGSGTAYLVRLEQTPESGYFRNTATYKKPPATATLKKVKNFKWPGLANFVSNRLVISPPSDRTILADEEISYATSQLSDVPYSVLYGTFFKDEYVRTNNQDVWESHQATFDYTLAGAASISGTDAYYNGMLCDSFSASLTSSSPTTTPSGLTVIDVDNQIYLVATDGTVVFRRVKVTYTF